MKMKNLISNILFPFFILPIVMSGCVKSEKKKDISSLPEDVKPAVIAIINDSPSEFAAAVSYPIDRPYPLKTIKDSLQMVDYYPVMIDDSIKKKVVDSPDSLWHSNWRGWTIDNGAYIWIDEGKIYAVNYVSRRENQLLDSLRNVEISTLFPEMRDGWTPVSCIIDIENKAIFRIDVEKADSLQRFRLAGYHIGSDLHGRPSLMLYGQLYTEGSMENRYYHFSDDAGNSADYSPDVTDLEEISTTIEINRKGKSKKYKVKPDYWLDNIIILNPTENSTDTDIK